MFHREYLSRISMTPVNACQQNYKNTKIEKYKASHFLLKYPVNYYLLVLWLKKPK